MGRNVKPPFGENIQHPVGKNIRKGKREKKKNAHGILSDA